MAPPAIINPETSLTSWSHTYYPRTEISYGSFGVSLSPQRKASPFTGRRESLFYVKETGTGGGRGALVPFGGKVKTLPHAQSLFCKLLLIWHRDLPAGFPPCLPAQTSGQTSFGLVSIHGHPGGWLGRTRTTRVANQVQLRGPARVMYSAGRGSGFRSLQGTRIRQSRVPDARSP